MIPNYKANCQRPRDRPNTGPHFTPETLAAACAASCHASRISEARLMKGLQLKTLENRPATPRQKSGGLMLFSKGAAAMVRKPFVRAAAIVAGIIVCAA